MKAIKRWREDPVAFVTEALGVQEIDAWQLEVLRAFPHKQRIAMKACKGPGKTAMLSWLTWNFMATRPHPKIAATSISGANLSDGLWSEMAKWQARSEFLRAAFEWTKTRIYSKDHPETWWMAARQWAKGADQSQQADTLAGLHADYILFVIDESGGVPDSVMAAAEAALATGIETKLVQAGNPTRLDGPLYRACSRERHLWFVIEITSDPDDPKRTPRVSIQWAREQIDKYGRDNPWVLVNVFGKFPPSSLNTLLGVEDVIAAMSRRHRDDVYKHVQKRLGIDVARFGDDSSIIFPRQGLVAFKPVQMRGARTHEIAARAMSAKGKWGSEMEFIDDTGGWGAGVIDAMIQGGHSPIPVNAAGKANDPRYLNKRAENWFAMAEWIKRGGALPNDQELVGELSAPTYTFHNGKFQLQPKDQIKSELGRSPDKADALALTFNTADMPAAVSIPGMPSLFGAQHKSEYDPFADDRL